MTPVKVGRVETPVKPSQTVPFEVSVEMSAKPATNNEKAFNAQEMGLESVVVQG
jgi:hypothetical protein